MTIESRLLAVAINDRPAMQYMRPLLREQDFTDEGWLIIAAVQDYYDADPEAPGVDTGWLCDRLAQQYPRQKELFRGVVESLGSPSVPNVVNEYKAMRKAAAGSRLAEALVRGEAEGIEIALEEYDSCSESSSSTSEAKFYVEAGLEDLLVSVKPENLIRVIPECLNQRLDGGLQPGNQVHR